MSTITDKPTKKLSKDNSIHITDEKINTILHLAAACLALLGAALLISQAAIKGNIWKITGFSIYSLTLMNLFVFSTLHHSLNGSEKVNKVMRTFDYISVFLLIAGTVSPLVLVIYRNAFGWAVFGTVWAVAATGITLRSVMPNLPKHITNTLYIVLGWLPVVLIADNPRIPFGALALLAAGGIIYSIGFAFYVIEKPNPKPGVFGFHEIWHGLVVIAASLHYLLMYFYVLPR